MGRPSRYPEEFRREAVESYWSSDRPRTEVARSLGISDGSLAAWVKQARQEAESGLDADERAELARLRKENRELSMTHRRRRSRAVLVLACLLLVLAGCLLGSPGLSAVVTNDCDQVLEVTLWLADGGSQPNEQDPAWSRFVVDPGESLSHGFATAMRASPTVVVFRIDTIGFRQRFESPGGAEVFRIVITEEMCSGIET